MAIAVEPVALHEAAYVRYLAYAMSVITSRALPDVRDGLKPVQRRILYTMFHELGLDAASRYRKCAAVVGEVMGKYHPHGDSSIYEALVRMAQPFSLRAPLVDGQGNFGSLDGDPPAAMRYTECRLTPIARELLAELGQATVDYRPTYDGQRQEPIVLPAQFPHLLINGVEGIAVGMATKIPPHNLGEIVRATAALVDDPEISLTSLLKIIRGPDFPTGGRLVASKDDLFGVYANGQGSMRVEATWSVEKDGRKRLLIIDSIPYGVNKQKILEKVGADVEQKKLPQVVDVRDESTDDVRMVFELKQDVAPETVVAWLFKHTDLADSFAMNLTVLIPTDRPNVCKPERIGLKECLEHWLTFRLITVRRRFAFDLAALRARIHVLDGFRIVFLDLDEVVRIVRKSEGKRDAAEKLIARFDLDEPQADAILELKLYRLARLEIGIILEELADKTARAAEIERILSDDKAVRATVKQELLEIVRLYGTPRRTKVDGAARELTYDADAYIVKEDAYVIVTRDGWIKRQSSFTNLDKIRVRDGDAIGWLIRAHTRSTLTFFSDQGAAYVLRVDTVPATTGHGDPLQRHFAFADGERIVGVVSQDARNLPVVGPIVAAPDDDTPPPPWAFAMTRHGRVLRFALAAHEEPSTKNGRRYARLDEGDRVLTVLATTGDERVCVASRHGNALVFPLMEVGVLRAAGKGVTGISLDEGDTVFACDLSLDPTHGLDLVHEDGREFFVGEGKMRMGSRGARGKNLFRRGGFAEWRNKKPLVQVGAADETGGES